MNTCRIVKEEARARDLSGTGAYRVGGRWNSKGSYMLYTSENSSLAHLEVLVHFDKLLAPPQLYIVQLHLDDTAPILTFADKKYPDNWNKPGSIACQLLGDHWMKERKYLAVKVRSAVNPIEFNYLLNPLFPAFEKLVKVAAVRAIGMDDRLI